MIDTVVVVAVGAASADVTVAVVYVATAAVVDGVSAAVDVATVVVVALPGGVRAAAGDAPARRSGRCPC